PPWMPERSRELYFVSLKNVSLTARLNISRACFLRVSASSGLRINREFGKPVNEQRTLDDSFLSRGEAVQLGAISRKANSPPRITARRGIRPFENDTSRLHIAVSAVLDGPLNDFRNPNLDRCG